MLRELRKCFKENNLSFYDAFQFLDLNKDGFLTIDEYSKQLDKISKFSNETKNGLFAYMDNLKIGMIDYSRFLNVVKKLPTDKLIVNRINY